VIRQQRAVSLSIRISAPATPEGVAGAHVSWAGDISALAPWKEDSGGFLAAAPRGDAFARVFVLHECGSTMDEAWRFLVAGDAAPWDSVLAVRQTSGRGQLRREWVAPAGNLSVSLVLPQLPPRLADMASLLLGHAAAEALEAVFGVEIRVKWPNDLLVAGGKVGGILVEERQERLVAGLGLNLFEPPPARAMRTGSAFPAAVLPTHPELFGPLRLWLELRRRFRDEIVRLCDEDSSAMLGNLLMKRLAFRGERVVVEDGAERFEARVLGVAEDGGLLVEKFGREGGVSTLYSGCLFQL